MIIAPDQLWWLLLLPLTVLPWLIDLRAKGAVRHAAAAEMAALPRSVRQRFLPALPLLRVCVLLLLVAVMLRPQIVDERTRVRTRGIAIQLVIDRSGSMDAVDYSVDGRTQTRLEVVRDVVESFVTGDGVRPGRSNDLIGVIAFGTFADSLAPLTLDHDHIVRVVRAVEIPVPPHERGTAIGDGLALAVDRLRPTELPGVVDAPDAPTGRVVLLLTDGENNSGDIDPRDAAEIARAFGVRVYTIGVGSARGVAEGPSVDPLTGRRQRMVVGIDVPLLEHIAERTGGRFFLATDRASLEAIYSEIDALERGEIEGERMIDVREAAISWTEPFGARRWPPIILLALLLLTTEQLLRWTVLRRLGP